MVYQSIQEPSRNDQVAVGASSVVVSEARTDAVPRRFIVIRNTSPNDADIITVNVGNNQAVANKGLVLRRWDAWTDNSDTGYACHQGSITAICATANGQLSITER